MKEIIALFEELASKGLVSQDKLDALKAYAEKVAPAAPSAPSGN